DLRHAKIYVSIFGDDEAKAQTLEALHHAQGFVRSELGRRIRLRHTPEISFRLDDSIERGHRINRLLRELAPEPQAAQSSEGRVPGASAELRPAAAREEVGDESGGPAGRYGQVAGAPRLLRQHGPRRSGSGLPGLHAGPRVWPAEA